jgi:hypothetical protein
MDFSEILIYFCDLVLGTELWYNHELQLDTEVFHIYSIS